MEGDAISDASCAKCLESIQKVYKLKGALGGCKDALQKVQAEKRKLTMQWQTDVQRYRDTCDDLVRANTRAQKALQESERSKQELIKELAFMHGEKVRVDEFLSRFEDRLVAIQEHLQLSSASPVAERSGEHQELSTRARHECQRVGFSEDEIGSGIPAEVDAEELISSPSPKAAAVVSEADPVRIVKASNAIRKKPLCRDAEGERKKNLTQEDQVSSKEFASKIRTLKKSKMKKSEKSKRTSLGFTNFDWNSFFEESKIAEEKIYESPVEISEKPPKTPPSMINKGSELEMTFSLRRENSSHATPQKEKSFQESNSFVTKDVGGTPYRSKHSNVTASKENNHRGGKNYIYTTPSKLELIGKPSASGKRKRKLKRVEVMKVSPSKKKKSQMKDKF